MASAIILTINLRGNLSAPAAHTTTQSCRVDVSPIDSNKPEWITASILHTDRKMVPCVKKMTIDSYIVQEWLDGACPKWEKKNWAHMSKKDKIEAYLKRYDEDGLGFTYSFLED